MIYRLIISVLIIVSTTSCQGEKEGIYPDRSPLTESVYASATVVPDSIYEVYSSVAGILQNRWVEEGDTVVAGQPLFQIDNASPLLRSENARLNYELAQKNFSGSDNLLKELSNQIATAALQYENDSIQFFRQKALWEQQVGSRNTYDQKKLAFELSGNKLRLLQQQYARTQRELETRLSQAENDYQTSVNTRSDYTINARINGRVYRINKEPGELITQQTSLGTLGSSSRFIIELLVDEADIVRVRPGQEVIISLDAYPGDTFVAQIQRILPQKNERNQSFVIEAGFSKTPEQLYSGLSGEANIVVGHKEETLSIPRAYLVNDTAVQTTEGLIKVVTGMKNLDRVEILEGIDVDTRILKPGQ